MMQESEAWSVAFFFHVALRPQKPQGLLGHGHLDFYTAPGLWSVARLTAVFDKKQKKKMDTGGAF